MANEKAASALRSVTGISKEKTLSIRPFIGAKDFETSRAFYRELGFEEKELFPDMSLFQIGDLAFYLQDAYVKDWVDNSMVFLEVADLDEYWRQLVALDLPSKFDGVRLSAIKDDDWGRECFLHDPSGILWHFGEFAR